jgi:5'-3' exonuclease
MGDSTDGIGGLPKVGPKTAELWLKDIGREEMPAFVLNKYIEIFGNHEGILKFVETFRLVYILKSVKEAELEIGIELPELEVFDIVTTNTDDLWE